ncbi:hypothetical protein AAIH46_08490 [Rhizobium sp. 0TCS1.26]|uniref:hypothetical protein n=1 Tax=Rhizobium sp. 0TCS1.26 TaxID=3142623 RepID=UPI003D26D06F
MIDTRDKVSYVPLNVDVIFPHDHNSYNRTQVYFRDRSVFAKKHFHHIAAEKIDVLGCYIARLVRTSAQQVGKHLVGGSELY